MKDKWMLYSGRSAEWMVKALTGLSLPVNWARVTDEEIVFEVSSPQEVRKVNLKTGKRYYHGTHPGVYWQAEPEECKGKIYSRIYDESKPYEEWLRVCLINQLARVMGEKEVWFDDAKLDGLFAKLERRLYEESELVGTYEVFGAKREVRHFGDGYLGKYWPDGDLIEVIRS